MSPSPLTRLSPAELHELRQRLDAVPVDAGPVSEELAAARAEFAEADRRYQLIQADFHGHPTDRINAVTEARADAARRVREVEEAERETTRREQIAEARAAGQPLLDDAAAELKTAEGRLVKAANAAQAALDAVWAGADEYETARARHATVLHRAGVTPVDDQDGSDGKAVRLGGRWFLPAPATAVIEWLTWRTLPKVGMLMPQSQTVRALMRGAWTLLVGAPARPLPPPLPEVRVADFRVEAPALVRSYRGKVIERKDLTAEDKRMLDIRD